MQNGKYAVEIYENLLIIIFSFAFETEKKNNFGKYIYNNLRSFKNNKNNKQNKINELDSWIKKDKFKELFNIYNNKVKIIDLENQKISFYYLLTQLMEIKQKKNKINNDIMNKANFYKCAEGSFFLNIRQ